MYLNAHPFLLYILIIYSIYIIARSKTINEFLLLLTIFLFLEAKNSWKNAIVSITTTPINIRIIDLPLIILLFYFLIINFKRNIFRELFIASKTLTIFFLISLVYTIWGVFIFGYASIAEFRLIFYYSIIILFIFSNVKDYEILRLIKKIAEYLMPLILLIPINIILTGNVKISESNRALGAFTYETITLGYIAGYFYKTYYDKKFKMFSIYLPIFLIFSIWANIRTVWAIIIASIIFKLIFEKGRTKIVFFLSVIFIFINIINLIDIYYIGERAKVFMNINEDITGRWRLHIWSTVIHNATFLGHGIGARFKIYAQGIGFAAEYGAHNGFIRIMHNLGYLGFSLSIIVFFALIIKFFKLIIKYKSVNVDNMIYKLSLMSVLALILYMIGYGPDLVSWIFISFGLKYNFDKERKKYCLKFQ